MHEKELAAALDRSSGIAVPRMGRILDQTVEGAYGPHETAVLIKAMIAK